MHPDFLERTVGHFYIQKPEGKLPTPTKGDSVATKEQPKGWCSRLWPFPARRGRRTSGDDGGKGAVQKQRWVPKSKAAFIQTPQVRRKKS